MVDAVSADAFALFNGAASLRGSVSQMNFIDQVDQSTLGGAPIAESDQFAIYAVGADTYLLVQRHQSMPWTGVQFSGDGVFRVGSLLVNAMRHLYRDVASNLSPISLEANARRQE